MGDIPGQGADEQQEIMGLKEIRLEDILLSARNSFNLSPKMGLSRQSIEKLASLGWLYSALKPEINKLISCYYSNCQQLSERQPSNFQIIERVIDDIEYLAKEDLPDVAGWKKNSSLAKSLIRRLAKEIKGYIHFRWGHYSPSQVPNDKTDKLDQYFQESFPEIVVYLDGRGFRFERDRVSSAHIENKSGEKWREERIYPIQIFSWLVDSKKMKNFFLIKAYDSFDKDHFIAAMRLNDREVGSYVRLMKKGADPDLALKAVKTGNNAITAYRQALQY